MEESQKIVDRVHQILCVVENLGQELQEARAENERLRVALHVIRLLPTATPNSYQSEQSAVAIATAALEPADD
jgi:hypothetical protein